MSDNPFLLEKIERVAFFGDAEVDHDSAVYKEVYKGAQLVANEGLVVVNGGGGGVMEAATLGAESVGGDTLTITFNPKDAPGFEGLDSDNVPDNIIEYDNYPDRLKGLLENADVYLLFKGGTGTLSEFGMVWVLSKIYYGKHKPFILVGDFWRPIVDVTAKNMLLDEVEVGLCNVVSRVEDAVELIKKWRSENSR